MVATAKPGVTGTMAEPVVAGEMVAEPGVKRQRSGRARGGRGNGGDGRARGGRDNGGNGRARGVSSSGGDCSLFILILSRSFPGRCSLIINY